MYLSWIRALATDSLPLIQADELGNIWALAKTNYGSNFGDYLLTSPSISVFSEDGSLISFNDFDDSLSPRWRTDGWGGYQHYVPSTFALDRVYGWKIAGVGGVSRSHYVPPFTAQSNGAEESPSVTLLPEQYLSIIENTIDLKGDHLIVGSYQAGWEDPLEALPVWKWKTPGYVSKISRDESSNWMVLLGDEQYSYNVVSNVSTGKDGSIFVAGNSDVPYGGSPNAFIAKLDPDGTILWQSYVGDSNEYEYINDLAVDAGGNIYVTGFKYVSSADSQAFVSRYSGEGDLIWHRSIGDNNTKSYAIALDGFGNVFVGGETYEELGASSGSWDAFVASFDMNGTQGELLSFGSTAAGNGHDVVTGLALDPEGEYLYVSGKSGNIFSWFSSLQGEAARWIDLNDWDSRSSWGDGFIGRVSLKNQGEGTVPPNAEASMDFTGDGVVDSTDALLMMRHMMGTFPGDAITQGIPNIPDAEGLRQKIMSNMEQSNPLGGGRRMDIDGDGIINPLSDGLAITQYIHGKGHPSGMPQMPDVFKNPLRGSEEMLKHLEDLVGF